MVISTDSTQMEDFAKRAAGNRADTLEGIEKARPYVTSEEGKKLLADLVKAYDKQKVLGEKVQEFTRMNSSAAAINELNKGTRPALNLVRSSLADLEQRAAGQSADFGKAVSQLSTLVERSWGQIQGATSSSSLAMLEERTASAKETRTKLGTEVDRVISLANAAGIQTGDFSSGFRSGLRPMIWLWRPMPEAAASRPRSWPRATTPLRALRRTPPSTRWPSSNPGA